MIFVGMTTRDTLVLVFLAETSYMNARDIISLMFLPDNMSSSISLGHPRKGLYFLCNWCSSSSSNSQAVGDYWGCSTFLELDPTSFVELFFFNNSGGNE
jgi:hypothetical protein